MRDVALPVRSEDIGNTFTWQIALFLVSRPKRSRKLLLGFEERSAARCHRYVDHPRKSVKNFFCKRESGLVLWSLARIDDFLGVSHCCPVNESFDVCKLLIVNC